MFADSFSVFFLFTAEPDD